MQLEEAIVGVVCGGCMVVWRGPFFFLVDCYVKIYNNNVGSTEIVNKQ